METNEIIGSAALFDGLPETAIEKVAAVTVERSYDKGETIFYEGDDADGFYLIGRGQVKIFKLSQFGKEHILHIFGPPEPIGEVAVFTGKPFPATAETLTECGVLFIPKNKFTALLEKNPSIALNMLALLSIRLRQFAAQIESLSLQEVPARLAAYLLYTSEEQQGGEVVELPVSKGQLAGLLGTIPETLSRIFAKMSAEGLIRVDGRAITIIDREGLRRR